MIFFFGQGSKYQNACLYVNFVLKFWNIKKWSLNTVLRNELEWTLTSGPDPQTLNCCLILFINRNIIYMYIFKYLLWNKTMTECTLKVRKLCRPILLFKKNMFYLFWIPPVERRKYFSLRDRSRIPPSCSLCHFYRWGCR